MYIPGLDSGYNYTVEVYSITGPLNDEVESLTASSITGIVKPVITSELREVPEESTHESVTLNYTESIVGFFDKYKFTIHKEGDETQSFEKDADEPNRKVAYQNL